MNAIETRKLIGAPAGQIKTVKILRTRKSRILKNGTRVQCSWGVGNIMGNDGRGCYNILLDDCRWVFGTWTYRVSDMRRDITVIAL